MLEYLYLICLLCLTISVPILIRGCFNIHNELPNQGGDISNRIDKVADLLDEMADLINNAVQFAESSTQVAQTASSPIMSILNAFMSRTPSTESHGSTQEQTQWEILQDHDKTQKETETIIDEYSTINPSG